MPASEVRGPSYVLNKISKGTGGGVMGWDECFHPLPSLSSFVYLRVQVW